MEKVFWRIIWKIFTEEKEAVKEAKHMKAKASHAFYKYSKESNTYVVYLYETEDKALAEKALYYFRKKKGLEVWLQDKNY